MRVYGSRLSVLIAVTYWLCCASRVTTKPVRNSLLTDQRIEAFKRKILMGLNYTTVPSVSNLSDSVQEKRRMIQLYREHIRHREGASRFLPSEEDDQPQIPTGVQLHSYTLNTDNTEKLSAITERNGRRNSVKIQFRINVQHPENDHNLETKVHLAKFKLFKHIPLKSAKDTSSNEIVIQISQILGGTDFREKKTLQSRIVDISRDGWEIFDLTSTVQEWIDNPSTNYGLEMYTDSLNISDLILPRTEFDLQDSLNNTEAHSHFPILEFQTHERSILKRVKRQDSGRRDCVKGDGENRCCRFREHISFSEIGWNDWIIAPEGFDAYYCDGECPHRFKMASNFAGIQSVLHLKHPTKFPKLCCVPSKLSPLTILHKDDKQRYVYTDYPDLVVEDCKCA